MKIVITGGPVPAKLDAVKTITNRFKGGLMCKLAEDIMSIGVQEYEPTHISYVCMGDGSAKIPDYLEDESGSLHGRDYLFSVVYHEGFHDYRKIVKNLALDADAVILGSAVANLIPDPDAWPHADGKSKFPSHNHKPNDKINIPFIIAPRIVDELREIMPYRSHLFAFKLLSGVPYDELISAAYEIVLESKASAVFANDAKCLSKVYAVTKERAQHPMDRGDVAETIWDMIHDEYYSTHKVEDTKAWLSYGLKTDKDKGFHSKQEVLARMQEFYERFKSKFVRQQGGYVFGSIATIANEATGSFVTTSRGKTEADVSEENLVYVHHINHAEREILIDSIRNRKGLSVKASLNAPLVHGIFHYLPEAHTVVHLHEQREELQTFPYAPPGTVRDGYNSRRTSGERKYFNVKNHGCYLIFNKIGEQI